MEVSVRAQRKVPVYTLYNSYDHSPLALGMIVANASAHDGGALRGSYEFVPELVSSVGAAQRLLDEHGAGVFLASNYLWSETQNLEVAKYIKQTSPESLIVAGGPSVPKYDYACESFFAAHSYIDIAVRGEGEDTAAALLERLAGTAGPLGRATDALADVAGITYRGAEPGTVVRTPERARAVDVDQFPSPYLDGFFDGADTSRWVSAIIETNRGCPYGCTFCDWGSATLSKIRSFALDRVRDELEWIAKRGVSVLWIADANFGVFDRDVTIAEMIADCKRRHGFPKQLVVNYAKHATERLAVIIRTLYAAGVAADPIISIQTHDQQTLSNINRSNIKTKRYEELIGIFRSERLPVTSDLMMGLPGATVTSFKADLQFFFDRKVYAKAYPTMVLPNSPMAHRDYMAKFQIKTDAKGYIISTSSYTRLDRWTMQSTYVFYRVLVGYSALKYYLYYLQADHRISALDLVEALQEEYNQDPMRMPETAAVVDPMVRRDPDNPWEDRMLTRSAADWERLHAEVAAFVESRYGVPLDSAGRAVLRAQTLLMPTTGRQMPAAESLEHDVEAYFRQLSGVTSLAEIDPAQWRPLRSFGPGRLRVTDPAGLCDGVKDKMMYDDHRIIWELSSGMALAAGVDTLVAVAGDA